MSIPSDDFADWSELETRLIRTVELFHHKPHIMKKVERRLESLKAALVQELSQHPGGCPPEADRVKGKIARGENNKGFPFISLDLPQWFTQETYFTYRTLFWWGHYLGFSLILKGGALDRYAEALSHNLKQPEADNVWLALFETPWEWELEAACFCRLQDTDEPTLRAHLERHGYLKLLRPYRVDDAAFPRLDWVEAGVRAYRDIARLIGV